MAYDILADKDLISSKKHHTGEYICQMHKSISPDEFSQCSEEANPKFSESATVTFLQ